MLGLWTVGVQLAVSGTLDRLALVYTGLTLVIIVTELIVVVGPVAFPPPDVLTVQVYVAGCPTMPAASVVRSVNVCSPGTIVAYVWGLSHGSGSERSS